MPGLIRLHVIRPQLRRSLLHRPLHASKPRRRAVQQPRQVLLTDITGKSERHARALLSRIRTTLGKACGGLVTVHGFCQATRLRPDDVEQFLLN